MGGAEAFDQPAAPVTHDFYAHVRVGDCDIAVPAAAVVMVVDLPEAGPLGLPRRDAQSTGALEGVMAFGDDVVPLVALDRWVPLGNKAVGGHQRALILRNAQAQIAVRIDAMQDVKRIAATDIRRLCHDAGEDELFESVVPATGERPLLCLLEVARLMTLASTWCEAADIALGTPGALAAIDHGARNEPPGESIRYVVVTIGIDTWAVPALAVSVLEKTPPVEFRLAGPRVCGIGTCGGRKLPLVDLGFAHDQAGTARPFMAVLTLGAHVIGLLVDNCERLVDLMARDVFATPEDELRAGTTMVAGLGTVSVLDIDRLFRAIPESTISQVKAQTDWKSATLATPSGTRSNVEPVAKVDVDRQEGADYLVFNADRSYASPATGLIGVMKLSQGTIDDFAQGRRATVEWQGQTLSVVRMPQIDGGSAKFEPHLAVVVSGAKADDCRRAVAVESLTRWLPARSAQRSIMRIPSLGDVEVITPQGALRSESLVVVDLAQMAELLA